MKTMKNSILITIAGFLMSAAFLMTCTFSSPEPLKASVASDNITEPSDDDNYVNATQQAVPVQFIEFEPLVFSNVKPIREISN